MNLLNNGFSRFLLSGFGTDTAAGKALGISIFLVLFVFIVAVYVIIGIVKICRGPQIPNFKNGPYAVRIDTVGNSSDLYNQLNRITGYRPALAKKVIDNVPTLAAKGLTRQDAEDFVTIVEATGATASVVAM
ncbi:MAG: hypothetical protein MR541_09875 [Prevotella sp.]|nr:hypothetical protein [Prevotella sp.]